MTDGDFEVHPVGTGAILVALREELTEAQAYGERMRSLLEETLPHLIKLAIKERET